MHRVAAFRDAASHKRPAQGTEQLTLWRSEAPTGFEPVLGESLTTSVDYPEQTAPEPLVHGRRIPRSS
jgi:hypothetical protein